MIRKTTLLLLLLCSFTLASRSQDLVKNWAHLLPENTSILSQEVDDNGNLVILSQYSAVVDYDPDNIGGETTKEKGYGVIKYDTNGNYLWSTFYEADFDSLSITDLGIDLEGNIYLYANYAETVDFDPSEATVENTSENESRDIALVKLNENGEYSTHIVLGGDGNEKSEQLYISQEGKIILSGSFDGGTQSGMDFNPDESVQDSLKSANTLGDGSDHFILRLHSDLSFDWVYQFDQSKGGLFTVNDITSNVQGDVFVCGDTDEWFRRYRFVDSDTVGYVMRIRDAGELVWKRMPNMYSSIPDKDAWRFYTVSLQSIAIGNTSDIYLSGYCELDTIIISLDSDTVNVKRYYDNATKEVFLTKIEKENGWQSWRKIIETEGDDIAHNISVNKNGNVYAFCEIQGDTTINEISLEEGAFMFELSNRYGNILKSKKIDVISVEQVIENSFSNDYYLSGRLGSISNDLALEATSETYYLSQFQFDYASDTTIWKGGFWSLDQKIEGYWTNGKPTIDMPAIIEGHYSTESQGYLFASSLIVKEGGRVLVSSSGSLEVDGEIINNGSIAVHNSGILLHSSYSGEGIFLISIGRWWSRTYHYLSSPVQGQKLLPILSDWSRSLSYEVGNSLSNKIENWHHITDSSYVMEQGKGYAIWRASGTSFRGVPNSGKIIIPLEYLNDDGNNLVGNPYPSPISGEQLLLDNPDISALYFWNDDFTQGEDYNSNDYITWNLSGASRGGDTLLTSLKNIAVGQGFFVQADTLDQNIIFLDEQRRTIDNGFYRKKGFNGRLWLKLESENNSRDLLIASMDWATEGFDKGWDALDFSEGSNNFSFSTLSKDKERLVIQALPVQNEYSIPIYLSNLIGKGEIEITEIEGFENVEVKLLDHKKGISWILSQSSYKFKAEEGDDVDRFSLSIGPKTGEILSLEKTLVDNIKIGVVENGMMVISSIDATLTVYNLSGQVVEIKEVKAGELFVPTQKGEILLFRFNSGGKSFTKKVIR